MRLSSSSLEMASARISCSERSAKRFTMASCYGEIGSDRYIRLILKKEDVCPTRGLRASEWGAMLDGLRRRVSFNRLMHVYWRFSRGLTLGVRALVLDA